MNDLILLATICIVAIISPGPDFLLISRNSLIYPRAQAMATAFGVISGCLLGAVYCTLGLALVIAKSIVAFSIIKYAGACYLIYLGVRGLFSKGVTQMQQIKEKKPLITLKTAFIQGFLCNILNPKLAVFLLSLFTQFISVNAGFSEKLSVAGVFILVSVIYWPALVIALQWKGIKNVFERFQSKLDRVFGALLIAIGIRVAVRD